MNEIVRAERTIHDDAGKHLDVHAGERDETAGDAAGGIVHDHRINADVGGSNIGDGQRVASGASDVGAVELPLVTQAAAGGADT